VNPIKKVLCPIDCSDGSKEALEYALFFAKQFGAKVHVLHAWHVSMHVRPDLTVWVEAAGQQPIIQVVETEARTETARFLSSFDPAVRAGIEVHLVHAEPSKAILETAARDKFDLIVMGTHGHTGLVHMAMGSVAERVVRHSPCPVLTVRRAKT
jgi:nucleotide-binding universal stress UspA family protein